MAFTSSDQSQLSAYKALEYDADHIKFDLSSALEEQLYSLWFEPKKSQRDAEISQAISDFEKDQALICAFTTEHERQEKIKKENIESKNKSITDKYEAELSLYNQEKAAYDKTMQSYNDNRQKARDEFYIKKPFGFFQYNEFMPVNNARWPYQPFKEKYTPPELVTIQGIKVLKDDAKRILRDFNWKKSSITHEIDSKYKKQFATGEWSTPWDASLANLISIKLKSFNLPSHLNILLQQYPWLIEELKNSSSSIYENFSAFRTTLAYECIFQFFKAELFRDCYYNYENAVKAIRSVKTQSNADDLSLENRFIKHIEDYPIKNIREVYQKPRRMKALEDEPNLLEAPLRRLDVYRFLTSEYHSTTQYYSGSRYLEKIGLQIAPFIADELTRISEQLIKNLQIIIVNIGTEAAPQWICLRKDINAWTAFIPAHFDAELIKQKLAPFIEKQKCTINYEVVDYTNNSRPSDIEGIAELTQWHAVLFNRVLPFCNQNQVADIKDYRASIPVDILLQHLLEKSLLWDSALPNYLSKAFAKRKPFIYTDFNQSLEDEKNKAKHSLMARSEADSSTLVGTDENYFDNALKNSALFVAFKDEKLKIESFVLNSAPDTLVMRHDMDLTQLNQAHFLMLHYPHIDTLILPPIEFPQTLGVSNPDSLETLFDLNPYLMSVKAVIRRIIHPHFTNNALTAAMRVAARNRFLNEMGAMPSLFNQEERRALWNSTGEQLKTFYQNVDQKFDADFVITYLKNKQQWYKNEFDSKNKPTVDSKNSWILAHMAQMGNLGLKQLVCALIQSQEEQMLSPFAGFFDLAGPQYEHPADYLSMMVQSFKDQYFFNALGFIVPDNEAFKTPTNRENFYKNMAQLFKIQSEPSIANGGNEVCFYNMDFNDTDACNEFFNAVETDLRSFTGTIPQLKLPDWDRAAFTEVEQCELKARYRALQNKIIAHNSTIKNANLDRAVAQIYQLENDDVSVEVKLRENKALLPQPLGEELIYPLATQSSSSLGIQQQLQQGVAQAFQQEQELEQEEELEEETYPSIDPYTGNADDLVDRSSIKEAKFADFWAHLPQKTRDLCGSEQADLEELFSLWVGSKKPADHVIAQMEPAAVVKLMEFAPSVRFGLLYEPLSPGFRLAHLPENPQHLILCFSEEQEQIDLQALNAKKPANKAFTLQLTKPTQPQLFNGDYRIFASLTTDTEEQRILWRFLSAEDQDVVRLDNLKAALQAKQINPEEYSVQMQQYTLTGGTTDLKNYQIDACLQLLKLSFNNVLNDNSAQTQAFLNSLFNHDSPSVLNANNLRAFGQLYYSHDVRISRTKAAKHFILLAKQIYTNFGPEYFTVWKHAVIDSNIHFADCLTRDEVDATTLSIASLKAWNNEGYTKIWWKLVEVQAKSCGTIRYAALWHQYQAFIGFLSTHQLVLNHEQMLTYLEGTNFQGLERLYFVLKEHAQGLEGNKICQNILDNLNVIDWRHNGYYYSVHFEKQPYWDEALHLTNFEASEDKQENTYKAYLDSPSQKLSTVVLGYAAQKMKLSTADFAQFKYLIQSFAVENEADANVLRLFVACLARGVDKLAEFERATLIPQLEQYKKLDPELLKWLNRSISLDNAINDESLQLKFHHLPLFIQAIEKAGIKAGVLALGDDAALEFINACGRALQLYTNKSLSKTEHPEEILKVLLQKAAKSEKGLLSKRLTTYPWIEADIMNWDQVIEDDQLAFFEKQLQSINFSTSKSLPTAQLVCDLHEIISAAPPAQKESIRKNYISDIIAQGCDISYQDAAYRPLSADEKRSALAFVNQNLKANYKSQNLALITQLFNSCLAISMSESAANAQEARLKKFCSILTDIDNKPHFNDLGMVLGLLLEQSRAPGKAIQYYSLEQLTSWLELLHDDSNSNTHFPLSTLRELLHYNLHKAKASSLLNSDLQHLQAEVQNPIHNERFAEIISSKEIPVRYKHILSKLALNSDDEALVTQAIATVSSLKSANVPLRWIQSAVDLITLISEQGLKNKLFHRDTVLTMLAQKLAIPEFDEFEDASILNKLWADCQVDLTKIYQANAAHLTVEDIELLENDGEDTAHIIKMITLQCLGNPAQVKLNDELRASIEALHDQLRCYSSYNLVQMAIYCSTQPIPSVKTLTKLLKDDLSYNVATIIHIFETVEQGLNEVAHSKRHYSVTPEEKNQLERILKGMKRKGEGFITEAERKELLNLLYYANSFSQANDLATISTKDLKEQLHQNRQQVLITNLNPTAHHQASARMLACMREILLRQTGKWVKHTQMLDLIYAVTHNDSSRLHQLRMGEGKSIITQMQTAYLALTGNVVDIFSSKESLSFRDYEEFFHVYDAMDIPNAYIHSGSEFDEYQQGSKTIGAVNIATFGNMALADSAQVYKHRKSWNVNPEKRVAWLDEADHIINDEKTQFNYAYPGDEDSYIYNFDEWVYRVTYEYYLNNRDNFIDAATGFPKVTNKHLLALCAELQKHSLHAPEKSEFMTKFIFPTLTENENVRAKAIKARDNELQQLLVAAHKAQCLQNNVDFSVRPEQQNLTDGIVVDSSSAKVVIASQVILGANYSERVHQFLDTRLNYEAIQEGKTPNFYVQRVSRIVLTSNVEFLLKKNYGRIEGCTGTAGNKEDLEKYDENYGITEVINMPTHEVIRTDFKGYIFCDSEEEQIDIIVKDLYLHKDRPILTTCKNDIAVKKIAGLIEDKIQTQRVGINIAENVIIDTNDSGRLESEIVPLAGDAGKVCISARMGRGTDIQPKSEEGLRVIRTYPGIPRVTKQEEGRQGRNGNLGSCLTIINYAEVLKDLEALKTSHPKRLALIFQAESMHLDEKLAKNKEIQSAKWDWLYKVNGHINEYKKHRYLITRSVQILKHELAKNDELYSNRKNYLINYFSDRVEEEVIAGRGDATYLFNEWVDLQTTLEDLWSARLAGGKSDSKETYAAFYANAMQLWDEYKAKAEPAFQSVKDALLDKETIAGYFRTNTPKQLQKYKALLNLRIVQNIPLMSEEIEALNYLQSKVRPLAVGNNDKIAAQILKLIGRYKEVKQNPATPKEVLEQMVGDISHIEEREELLEPSPSSKQPIVSHIAKEQPNTELGQEIAFYQSWIQGAGVYYHLDADGYEKLNRKTVQAIYGKQGLDLLYATLSKVGATASTEIYKRRVAQLFKTLCKLPKPQLYWIPLADLAESIEFLSSQLNSEYFDNYLECFSHFFEEGLLNSSRSAEQVKIFGRLLNFAIRIMATDEYVDDVKDLISGATCYIADVCESFDEKLLNDFETAFITHSKILAKHYSPVDVAKLLELVNLNKYQGELRKERINSFNQYLNSNYAELMGDAYPALKTIMCGIFRPENDTAENFIPSLKSLEFMGLNRVAFIEFLNRRRPNSSFYVPKLVSILKDNPTAVQQLLNLPDHISCDYIWANSVGPNIEDNLDKISEAAKAFNRFAFERRFILSADHFDPESFISAEYVQFKALFSRMPVTTSADFFETCASRAYESIPLSIINLVANKSIDDRRYNNDQLKSVLNLYTKINDFSAYTHANFKNALFAEYEELFSSYGFKAKLEKLNVFVDKIAVLDLSDEQLLALWDKWKDSSIANLEELSRVLTSIEQAKNLQKSGNWSDYFTSYTKGRSVRTSIMKLLCNGVLDLGTRFFNDFTSRFKELVSTTIIVPDLSKATSVEERRTWLTFNSQKIAAISRDLVSITNYQVKITGDVLTTQKRFFKAQQEAYQSMWWKNSDRRKQAKDLFAALDNVEYEGITSLTTNLNIIWQAQDAILQSDKDTNRNTKGYSRLYDITVQMFLHVARDYLHSTDRDVRNDEWLNNFLDLQLKEQITMLDQQLPDGHPGKQLAVDYKAAKNVSADLDNFKAELHNINRAEFPKNLQYLVTNIQSFAQLQENLTPQQEEQYGGLGFDNQ